ncbi:MAG TPA: hypothetical protein VK879_15995 [Candidatus Sulfomarinibacteraceae bacterium]|nr:hypothetical protein [Candidatus Sulfomarinibacteraceae bacterium]
MEGRSVSKLGGTCAILVGISYVFVGIFHTLSPMEHRISSGPELFLPAIASGFSFSTLVGWSFALGALCALAAIPAIADQFRELDHEWIDWMRNLALLGYAITAVNEFTIFVSWPSIATAYVEGEAAIRAALAAQPLLPLDPQGWLLYGAVGAFVFVVSFLALRSEALPKPLSYIGLAAGMMFWLALLGFILDSETLISIGAGLGAVILVPIWYIWVGLRLRRTEPVQAARPAPAV